MFLSMWVRPRGFPHVLLPFAPSAETFSTLCQCAKKTSHFYYYYLHRLVYFKYSKQKKNVSIKTKKSSQLTIRKPLELIPLFLPGHHINSR